MLALTLAKLNKTLKTIRVSSHPQMNNILKTDKHLEIVLRFE